MLSNFAPAALTSGTEKLEAYWLLYKIAMASFTSAGFQTETTITSALVNSAFLFDHCSCFTIAWQQKSQKNSGLAITWTQRHRSLAYCICAWTDIVALQLLACTVLFKILGSFSHQRQRHCHKLRIWLLECGKIIVLHVRHVLLNKSVPSSAKQQREITTFTVLINTWEYNR